MTYNREVTLKSIRGTYLGESGDSFYVESTQKGFTLTGIKSVTVTTTASEITKIDSNRNYLRLNNFSDEDVFIGGSSVVTGDGYPLYAQTWQEFNIDKNTDLYVITSTGSNDLRVMEGKI